MYCHCIPTSIFHIIFHNVIQLQYILINWVFTNRMLCIPHYWSCCIHLRYSTILIICVSEVSAVRQTSMRRIEQEQECSGEGFQEDIMFFVTWTVPIPQIVIRRSKMTSTFPAEEYGFPFFNNFTTEGALTNFSTSFYNDSFQGEFQKNILWLRRA